MRTKVEIVYNNTLLESQDLRRLKVKHIKKHITPYNISKCYNIVLANVIMSNGIMTEFMGKNYESIYHIDEYIIDEKHDTLHRDMLMLAFIYVWLGE